jgi:putative glutamine amidotransferase
VERRRAGAHLHGLEPDRDELEISLLHAAGRGGVPVLCICRGMQVMNVAFGGTLFQHLPDRPGPPGARRPGRGHGEHARREGGFRQPSGGGRARRGADLFLSPPPGDIPGTGILATGWSEDGLVEAIEREAGGWMLGVRWHPEDTADEDPGQQRLFDTLVERARMRIDD